MKTKTHHYILTLLLLVALSTSASELFSFQEKVEEKVILFTDRSIYITGEEIQFSATLLRSDGTETFGQSLVLYCELITPDGNIISNNKYLFSNSIAGGCVTIPGDLLTGFYYIRAYTKLMRNFGSESFEYKQIRIINPHRTEVLESGNNQNIPRLQLSQTIVKENKDLLSVSVDSAVYGSRDTIILSYEQVNRSKLKIKSMCLSVIPENSKTPSSLLPAIKEPIKVETGYYAETRGLSLVGKLTEEASGIPVIDKKINLSIIGEGRDFMASRTDTSGRFYFALPAYYGARDLFLCAEKIPSKTVKIWVDNDFSSTAFQLPSPAFTLTEDERYLVQNMAQNVQINSQYRNEVMVDSLKQKKDTIPFYGKSTTTIILDNYIQLPTLEEYFNELTSQVKVRNRKGEPYFSVQSSVTDNLSFYDPLVLVDWVAIDEPSKILAVSPQNISRIEVVNESPAKARTGRMRWPRNWA